MTLVNIDLRNQGYETGPDDRVIFYSLLVREGDFGTISTAPVEVRLTDGKATIDLAPGPVGVQIIAGQVADTRIKIGEVPSSGPTTLGAVMMVTPAYTPALQQMMIAAIERAKDLALTRVDGEVALAVDEEVGEFKSKAEQALAKSTAAESKSDVALSKSTTAESSAGNAVSRVEALEVMGGLTPGEPVDGQTANLIGQENTLSRQAVNSAIQSKTRDDIDPPISARSVGMTPALPNNSDPLLDLFASTLLNDRPGVIPRGVYTLSDREHTASLPGGAFWSLQAEPGAILKNADQSVDRNWHATMIVESAGTGDVERVDIDGLGFDPNWRNQIQPEGAYSWEHSAALHVSGKAGSRIKNVSLRNLYFRDPIADCVWSNSYHIDTLMIHGMYVRDRSSTRSDIQLSGLPRVTQISNFIGWKIECEPVRPPEGQGIVEDFLLQISDSWVGEMLDLASPRGTAILKIQVNNVTAASDAIFGGVTGVVANSRIHFSGTGTQLRRINYSPGLIFDNCDLYLHSDALGNIAPLTIYRDGETDVQFNNCRFHLVPHPDFSGESFTGAAVQSNGTPAGEQYDSVVFNSCWFDRRFETSARIDRTRSVKFHKCDLAGTQQAIMWTATNSMLEVIDCDLSRAQKFMFLAPVASGSLRMSSSGMDYAKSSYSVGSGLSNLNVMDTRSDRLLFVDSAPTGAGFKGDRARLSAPANGQPFEWVCTHSSPTAATWAVTQSLPPLS